MKEQHNNKTWYIIGGVVIALLIILLISINSNSNKGPVCNSPYILNGNSCCLDSNYNSICDNDEPPQQNTPVNNYREYQVNAYITHDFIQSLSALPSYPAREYTNYPVWDAGDARYYTAGNLVLYTDYDAEPITCIVKEYYASTFNEQFTINIVVGYYVTGIGYEKSNLPSQVRYDYDCTGQQSGKKYSSSYRVDPVANN